jgi:ABC-2 type transport system permease protein
VIELIIKEDEMSGIYNFSVMTRFLFRRKWLWMLLFMAGILFLTVGFTPMYYEVAGGPAELSAYYETMKNPAMTAMCGPLYSENYTFAVMWTQMMLSWTVILVGIMSIFFITNTTRNDEADGRLEVLSSLPIGRVSVLFSSILIMVVFNLITGLLMGVGNALLGLGDMDMAWGLTIGAASFACGIFYGGVAAITSQICETSRGAKSLAILILGIGYMLRAMGDVQADALNYLTPFGLAFKAKPYAENNLVPILIIIIVAIVLFIVAFLLNHKRSMYAGYLPTKRGRRHAVFLSGPFTLGLRLVKNQIIAWAIILMLGGASFGSIFGDINKFFTEDSIMSQIIGTGGGTDFVLSFVSYLNLVLSLIASIPIIGMINRLRAEEKAERLEQVYSKKVSKIKTLVSFLGIAFVSSIIFQFCTAIGIYGASSAVLEDKIEFSVFLKGLLAALPAMWIFLGVAVFLTGVLPRLTSLTWVLFAITFFMVYMGKMLNLPDWANHLTPFSNIPDYPIGEIEFAPLAIMTAIFIGLSVIGIVGYRKRDLIYK